MKKKLQKIILSIIISLIVLAPYAHAGILDDASAWLSAGSQGKINNSMIGKVNSGVAELSGFLYSIGVLIAIIATVVLGIKYMTASGSESKADVKKKAIIVGVGVLILFASATIWQIVVGTLSSAT